MIPHRPLWWWSVVSVTRQASLFVLINYSFARVSHSALRCVCLCLQHSKCDAEAPREDGRGHLRKNLQPEARYVLSAVNVLGRIGAINIRHMHAVHWCAASEPLDIQGPKTATPKQQNYDLRKTTICDPVDMTDSYQLSPVILWTANLLLAFCTNTLISIFTLFYVCFIVYSALCIWRHVRLVTV